MSTQVEESSSSSTSPTLLSRVRQHDAAAWRTFVDLYGPLVLYWVRRHQVSAHEADDIVQNVCVAVMKNVHRWRSEGGSRFRSWLWVITRNHVAQHCRRRATHAVAEGGSVAWLRMAELAERTPDDASSVTEAPQISELYRRAMGIIQAEFEERSWKVFLRSVVDEVPTSDVAGEFAMTSAAVRQIRSRILRRLRSLLDD